MPHLLNSLTDGFMPHGYCLRWEIPLLFVFIVGNIGIAIAYFLVPAALRYFVGKRQDLPYPHMFKLFAAFIMSCGITHLMKVWTLYQPVYWLEAIVDLWTAAVSLLTAGLLIPLIPAALKLRSPAALDEANEKLRKAAEELQAAKDSLELQVEQRTAELVSATRQAQEGEALFRALFDVMPQLGWTASADGGVTFYNRGWYEYTGTTWEQMEGWGWESVTDPEMLEEVKVRWMQSPLPASRLK